MIAEFLLIGGAAILTASATENTRQRQKVINFARKFIGSCYSWSGTTPNGFDCSGFIYYVLKEFKPGTIRTTVQKIYETEPGITKPKPGDLIIFYHQQNSHPWHVAIYTGNNKMIHSSYSKGVNEQQITPYYQNAIVKYVSIL